MAHKPSHGLLSILSATSLLSGISMTAAYGPLYASLSSPGTTVLDTVQPAAETLRAASGVPPEVYQQADAALQLTIGILLIVLGFFLHGLVRMREARPVHITVKPKKKRTAWFWMEMHV